MKLKKYFFKNKWIKNYNIAIIKNNINNLKYPRIGLIIKKKYVKLSVKRNKIKRIIYEIFRKKQYKIKKIDYLLIIKKNILYYKIKEIKKIFIKIWNIYSK